MSFTKRAVMGAMAAGIIAASTAAYAQQRTNIEVWIGLTGPAQEEMIKYGQEFNASQTKYNVNVTFRGQYPEQRAAAFAAFRSTTRARRGPRGEKRTLDAHIRIS
jgi:sn-glycerol 3-phosphate transport system substrate-binding protein